MPTAPSSISINFSAIYLNFFFVYIIIAVIGGGIGGATVAHYLNELFSGNLSIDLFEAEIIGGRLATIQIDGNEYEAGGSVIHERNLLMKRFLTLLGIPNLILLCNKVSII